MKSQKAATGMASRVGSGGVPAGNAIGCGVVMGDLQIPTIDLKMPLANDLDAAEAK
jgi:sortase (surface protein transpeptidase)